MDVIPSAQRFLSEGNAQAAVDCLEKISQSSGLDLDGHLLMAEALWTQAGPGGTEAALPHYEEAAALAGAGSDVSKKATVSLGHGFALLQLKHFAKARSELLRARSLAEEDGNPAAAQFVDSLLRNTEAAQTDDAFKSTWLAFADAYTDGTKPVLFMRGSAREPLDAAGAHGVEKLRAAGVKAMKVVDLSETGPELPGGLQTLADVGIELPQLYLKGASVERWMDLEASELRRMLQDSGVTMKDPAESEPCHGAFSDGLADWEVALVEMVSISGAGDWEVKSRSLAEKGFQNAPATGKALEKAWQELSPSIKVKLESQPEMPCGHSCSTCPTKHDCQLHDAVGHVRDIEDLI